MIHRALGYFFFIFHILENNVLNFLTYFHLPHLSIFKTFFRSQVSKIEPAAICLYVYLYFTSEGIFRDIQVLCDLRLKFKNFIRTEAYETQPIRSRHVYARYLTVACLLDQPRWVVLDVGGVRERSSARSRVATNVHELHVRSRGFFRWVSKARAPTSINTFISHASYMRAWR